MAHGDSVANSPSEILGRFPEYIDITPVIGPLPGWTFSSLDAPEMKMDYANKLKKDKEATQAMERLGILKNQKTSRDAQATGSKVHREERGTPVDTPVTGEAKPASEGTKEHRSDELAQKVRNITTQRVCYSRAAKRKYKRSKRGEGGIPGTNKDRGGKGAGAGRSSDLGTARREEWKKRTRESKDTPSLLPADQRDHREVGRRLR